MGRVFLAWDDHLHYDVVVSYLTESFFRSLLEFDHVVILDGKWSSASQGEDPDAPRRLYYVAMTRARLTLTLAKTRNSNPFLQDLVDHASVLVRPGLEHIPPAPHQVSRSYLRLSLRDVQLSFAGYRSPNHPIHKAIAGLSAGDPLNVNTDRSPWEVSTSEGITVGRLAQAFGPPPETGDVSATALAIARWSKTKSEATFHDRLRTDEWEVVIPEIVTGGSP